METQDAAAPGITRPATPGWRLPRMQELGLLIVIVILGAILALHGAYEARDSGGHNRFLDLDNLVGQIATYMAFYAIMAVGVTCVIIAGGIDISVGSIYALSALGLAGVLQNVDSDASAWKVLPLALLVGPGIGLICGLINGALVTGLQLHPFIVTLGTMSVFRGIANVAVRIRRCRSRGWIFHTRLRTTSCGDISSNRAMAAAEFS